MGAGARGDAEEREAAIPGDGVTVLHRFEAFLRGSYGWVAPALAAGGWTLWSYLRLRPPRSVTAHHLAAYERWSWHHLSYSDVLHLYRVHALYNHAAPYIHTAIEYPVLTGLFMWVAAWFPGVQGYFAASAAGLGICVIVSVWLLYRSAPRRAWIFALSPLLVFYALLNWDMLAIALMLLGWDAYRRRRYLLAGVWLSAGTFAKLFPAVLLLFCAAELWGEERSAQTRKGRVAAPAAGRVAAPPEGSAARRNLVRLLGGSVAFAAVVNLPFVALNPVKWGDFYSFNATRHDTSGILYELHIVSGWPIAGFDALIAVLVGGFAAFFIWRVLHRRATAEVAAAATFTFFILLNKTFSPQYMVWILVFGLMAGWPGWTYAGIMVAGLVDFVDASITFTLIQSYSRAWSWYWTEVYHLNLALRNSSIAVALAGALWDSRSQRCRLPRLQTSRLRSSGSED